MGEWIEIHIAKCGYCGAPCLTLHGWVDWNAHSLTRLVFITGLTLHGWVDWNYNDGTLFTNWYSLTLHGWVDWNIDFADKRKHRVGLTLHGWVDWNIILLKLSRKFCKSHPSWVSGLKSLYEQCLCGISCLTLHGWVDWKMNPTSLKERSGFYMPLVNHLSDSVSNSSFCMF